MSASKTCCGTRQKSYVRPARNRIFMRRVIGSYPTAEMALEATGIMFMGIPLREEAVGVGTIDSKRGMNPHPFTRSA